MSDESPYLEARGLSLVAGGQALLERVDLRVGTGELVLLVGASGSGKSVLMRVLAGLVGQLDGVQISGEVASRGRLGMVFQHGALFEGLSVRENLQLALDHARPPRPWSDGETLLSEVRLPADLQLSSASGGQRRRVAIARALAANPDVLLYDEPTTGLDPELARRVAQLIRTTHDKRQMATLVVTHDIHALGPIADRVLFLDPRQRTLREVPASELPAMIERGEFGAETPAVEVARGGPLGGLRRALVGQGAAVASGLRAIAASALPRWRRLGWGLRAFRQKLGLVAGPTSMAYVGLAGAVAGCVAVYFSYRYLPYPQYLRALVRDDLLGAIGYALYRILVPILATILIAARCGAAVASDLAGRSYREEHDALRSLGGSPGGYHGFAALASLTLATPVLVFFSFLIARAVALATFGLWAPDEQIGWIEVMFHTGLRKEPDIFGLWRGTSWVLLKSLACGLVIGLIAVATSMPPKRIPQHVSSAVTRTVLLATAGVLLVHFAFAFVEFPVPKG